MAIKRLGRDMSVRAILSIVAALCVTTTAALAEPLNCPGDGLHAPVTYVGDAETARAIFIAIKKNYGGPPARSGGITVTDRGSGWLVSRNGQSNEYRPDGSVLKHLGGGTMTLRIDKCTGALSDLVFAR